MEQNEVTTARFAGETQQNVIMVAKKKNGLGTTGFIFALIGLFLFWVPILDWILWVLGFIFSFIGVFKKPRGLSIAGLAISVLGVILIIALAGAIDLFF